MTDDLVARLSDHERIWLQNEDDAKNQCEGRLWCEDKVWPDDPEDGEPTEYIRADLHAVAEARVRELEAVNAALNERAAQYERLYRNAQAETIERCAKVMDDHYFCRDIDWWLRATRKDAAREACETGAAAIRKLAQEEDKK